MEVKYTTPERKPYALGKAIQAVKNAVRIEQVAGEYGTFKLAGTGRLLGRCIASDHTDRTPSFTVFTDTQRFRCFGCGLHGDVLDLEEIGGRHVERWTAVIALAERHGIDLPRRPERWHKRQDEKSKAQDVATKARKAVRRERLFKLLVLSGPEFDIEDEGERREAVAQAWEIFNSGMERIGQ